MPANTLQRDDLLDKLDIINSIYQKDNEKVKYLLDVINFKNSREQEIFYNEIFFTACYLENITVIKLILKHTKAEIANTVTKYGHTALHIAIYKNNIDIIKLLVPLMALKYMVLPSIYDDTPLHEAAKKNNQEIVSILIKYYPPEDINKLDEFNRSALHYAVLNNNFEIAKQLLPLMSESTVNAIASDGYTALDYTALNKNNNLVDLLHDQMSITEVINWLEIRYKNIEEFKIKSTEPVKRYITKSLVNLIPEIQYIIVIDYLDIKPEHIMLILTGELYIDNI